MRRRNGTPVAASRAMEVGGPPPLYGLVLGGGKSVRMGTAKEHLRYPAHPAYRRLLDLFEAASVPAYLSVASDSRDGSYPDQQYPLAEADCVLVDALPNVGPAGGLHTAHLRFPSAAWFVVACDLPFVDERTVSHLIARRSMTAHVTAYIDREGWIQPVCAIWEPRALERLQRRVRSGRFGLYRSIVGGPIHTVPANHPFELCDVDTPEELRRARSLTNPAL